jgi:hypothetical protein
LYSSFSASLLIRFLALSIFCPQVLPLRLFNVVSPVFQWTFTTSFGSIVRPKPHLFFPFLTNRSAKVRIIEEPTRDKIRENQLFK